MRGIIAIAILLLAGGHAGARPDARVGAALFHELVAPPGEAPFHSIQIFRVEKGAQPHWLFLTSGLKARGARGELSLRVPLSEEAAPQWAPSLLLYLAGYADRSTAPLQSPTFIDLAGPTERPADDGFVGAILVADPLLRGKPAVDAIAGLTADELALVRGWSPSGWAEVLRARNPLFVSPRERPSLLADAGLAREVRARADREGSELTELAIGHCACARSAGKVVLELGANGVRGLVPALQGRLALGRPLRLSSPAGIVDLVPGTAPDARPGRRCTITLSAADARELARSLKPMQGDHAVGTGLLVRVVPSVVRDEAGGTTRVGDAPR